MARLTMEVSYPRRRAIVQINNYWSKKLSLPAGDAPCHILGVFQDNSEGDEYPVFICELYDGRVMNAYTGAVRFVDTENGVIQ